MLEAVYGAKHMPLINTRIMSHPLNWAIVTLMVVIAGIGGHTLLSYLDQEPARAKTLPEGLTTEQLSAGADAQYGFASMSSLAAAQAGTNS